MSCLIARPDPQTLFNQCKDSFSANVLGGSPVIPESNEWYVVSMNYAMSEEFHAISEQQWKERDPRYACCDNLVALAAADGVFPYPASFATGYVILTGAEGSTIPVPLQVLASNGRTYQAVGQLPTLMPSSGSIYVRVQDIQAGPAGNSAGTVTEGTLVTTNPGIVAQVVICGGTLCGGRDAEQCEAFRSRYIRRKQYQPRATQAWAIEKLLEWPCATRVIPRGGSCCTCDDSDGGCGCKTCGTTLDFYVMFDNTFPCGVAPASVLQEIQTWMFGETQGYGQGQVEIGVCGSIRKAIPFLVDVYVDIVGCPTISQTTLIRENITDLLSLAQPSQPLRARQVSLSVASVLGSSIDSDVRFVAIEPDETKVHISPCYDLEPECDYLPCLRNIYFTGPDVGVGSCS